MKRWNYISFFVGLVFLGMTGCSTKGNNSDITITPTPILEYTDNKVTEVPTTQLKEEKSAFKEKEETSLKKVVAKTEGLCEVLEKTDTIIETNYNSFHRMLSTVSTIGLEGNSLFCFDETTGVVYFVNQGKDYYLYRIKEGEIKLVLSMPVKELYCYEGSIYFMIDDYDIYELEGMYSGDIYCYTPTSGAVQLVYAAGAIEDSKEHKLLVEESGIYFCYRIQKSKTSTITHYYHLPFGATEPIKDMKCMVVKGWRDYFFSVMPNLVLINRTAKEDGTRETIDLSSIHAGGFCVVGDILYSTNKGSVFCTNLETKEVTRYDFSEAIEKLEREGVLEEGIKIIDSFIVIEDDLWITTGGYLYCMNLQSGEIVYAYTKDNNNFCSITNLYTDGKTLYGLQELFQKGTRMVRLLTDDMDNSGVAVVGVEALVE